MTNPLGDDLLLVSRGHVFVETVAVNDAERSA